tara:strand:- start:469 stop:663 length:195 start_codon:yes stop_codon:yes gene_type:complete
LAKTESAKICGWFFLRILIEIRIFFSLLPTLLCMISLRVSALKSANKSQIESPQGLSKTGYNQQ